MDAAEENPKSNQGHHRYHIEVSIFFAGVGQCCVNLIGATADDVRTARALHRMGIRTLTGDAKRVATAVGSSLGIKEIEAELLPEGKLARVKALVAQKRIVAMVGDGVNDAPALAEAV